MRSDEFITSLYESYGENGQYATMKKHIPLGTDSSGNVVFARKEETPFSLRHVAVTGAYKTAFIRRLLLTLSRLYKEDEICFFVLSCRADYGELVRVKDMDVTVPYIRSKDDFDEGINTLKALLKLREVGRGYPSLILVLDGIEELDGCNKNGDLEEYRDVFELVNCRQDVDVITGAELTKSIFSGYPSAFVGAKNCLVATREQGKADVTYFEDDASTGLPMPITYPSEPSITETVVLFNSMKKAENND